MYGNSLISRSAHELMAWGACCACAAASWPGICSVLIHSNAKEIQKKKLTNFDAFTALKRVALKAHDVRRSGVAAACVHQTPTTTLHRSTRACVRNL